MNEHQSLNSEQIWFSNQINEGHNNLKITMHQEKNIEVPKQFVPEPRKSLVPVLSLFTHALKICGVYCWMNDGTKDGVFKKIVKVVSAVLCIFAILMWWANTIRIVYTIEWTSITSRSETTKLMYLIIYIFLASGHLSDTYSWSKHISKLRSKLESSRVVYTNRTQVTLKVIMVVVHVTISLVCFFMPYNILTKTRAGFGNLRTEPFVEGTVLWDVTLYTYGFLMYVALLRIATIVSLMVFISFHFWNEINCFSNRIRQMRMKTLAGFEDLRRHFEDILSLVQTMENLLSFASFLSFACSIPILCFTLYAFIQASGTLEEITMFVNGLATSLVPSIAFIVMGSYIESKSKGIDDALFGVAMTDVDELAARSFQMLVTKVNTAHIRITCFGFFDIQKSTALTLVGTIVTYIVVVLQFSPGIAPTSTPCNCTT